MAPYFPVKPTTWLALLPLLASAAVHACPPLPPAQAASLTLPAVLARLPACNPDVRAAAAAAGGAAADVLTAGQAPNPQLTVGAGQLSRDGIGSGNLWNKTLDHQLRVDQQIERGDKPALRRAAAQALQQAARADTLDALRNARVSTTRLFFDLAAALARQQELTATVALNEESQQALDRRAKAGDAAPLDAVRFQLDATRVQADLRQAAADVQALRLQLALAIGAASDSATTTPLVPATDYAVAAPASTPSTADLVEQRPDVQAAQARVMAAEQARALALSQRTRDVGVGVALSHYPASPANSAGTGNTVSLSVTVPLFVRHAFEGEIARADADVRTAQEVLQRVRSAALADVARAQSDWLAADARHTLASQQLLPAAERVAAGAELAYKRGASGVLDLLDARRSLRAARVEQLTAQAERAKAAAQLEAATRPLDPQSATAALP